MAHKNLDTPAVAEETTFKEEEPLVKNRSTAQLRRYYAKRAKTAAKKTLDRVIAHARKTLPNANRTQSSRIIKKCKSASNRVAPTKKK